MIEPPVRLCLTFDNMGSAAAIRRGELAAQDAADLSMLVGYPRILTLLERLNLKATFFIEGWNAIHNPRACHALVAAGHEIGLHGWIHEVFHQLTSQQAEAILVDCLAAFRQIGIEPRGFRAPGGKRGEGLTEILLRHGLAYDSSSNGDQQPMQPTILPGGLPNVPWRWPQIDYYQYYMHPEGDQLPSQVEHAFRAALRDARNSGELVTYIFHAFVSGIDDARFGVLERLLEEAAADESIEVLTAGQVAASLSSVTAPPVSADN